MKFFSIYTLISLVLITACTQSISVQDDHVKNYSALEFKKLIDEGNGQLIDVRTSSEYNSGHIEGAILIDYYSSDFKGNLNLLDKEIPVYIYCRSGNRSSNSVSVLRELGFKEIVNLKKGISDWQRNGYLLTKP